jgi:hypothetical protein
MEVIFTMRECTGGRRGRARGREAETAGCGRKGTRQCTFQGRKL